MKKASLHKTNISGVTATMVRSTNIAKELVTNRRIAKGCAVALIVTGAALLSCPRMVQVVRVCSL